ncbi:ABC transporter ATP-binding protein [Azospirillum sp.]|uniref:ABC transporter ATP-binding protein n=1 Tax=Azospirillum sp. TaxID=34012 RepID=UPI002D32743F|nr:ABC transporter ATP-binding protein [Azospirillum sp.]HYD64587.1 ABC transporter ATP-binding protein [Azospirillum sp.]
MASVVLESLRKAFGGLVVVDSVSMRIEDGELMVFVGPSGCGKSTTLRMIAGLEPASGGDILIGGRRVTELEPKDRNVAMVFQNYALYPHKSVYDNLAFGLRMRGAGRAEIEARVRRAAAMLGLADLLDRKPRQLSGGQMQRVALGRALVREPDVFLLDEPLSNLDAKLRVHMREEIARLHAEVGTSMVYVTHDQVEAMTLGSRICVMKDGRVQQLGAPLEVYDRPANRFVAGFIGSPEMNFVDGELAASPEGPEFRAGGVRLPLAGCPGAERATPGDRVTLGIRPEHLEAGLSGGLSGMVVLVEQMGSQTLVLLRLDGAELRAVLPRDDRLAAGQPLALRVAPERIHLFDAGTGLALRPH